MKNKSKISYKVSKQEEWDKGIMFQLSCLCHYSDHQLTFEVDYNDDLKNTYLNIYGKVEWFTWAKRPLCYWKRFKAALRLFFTGWLEMESGLILGDEDHVTSLIYALQECIEKMQEINEK